MCLKLSMASRGRSADDFPRWFNGCENLWPSAWTAVIEPLN